MPGALLVPLVIFLPSFFFVAGSSLLLPYVRRSTQSSAFFKGVSIEPLGLMAGVTLQLSLSPLLLLRYPINTTWRIADGALAGLAHLFLR